MTRSSALLLSAVAVLSGCAPRPFLFVFAPVDGATCPVGPAPRLDAVVYLLHRGNRVPLLGESLLEVTVAVDAEAPEVVPYDQVGRIGWDLPTGEGRHDVRVEVVTASRSFATAFEYTVSPSAVGTECVAPSAETGDGAEDDTGAG